MFTDVCTVSVSGCLKEIRMVISNMYNSGRGVILEILMFSLVGRGRIVAIKLRPGKELTLPLLFYISQQLLNWCVDCLAVFHI